MRVSERRRPRATGGHSVRTTGPSRPLRRHLPVVYSALHEVTLMHRYIPFTMSHTHPNFVPQQMSRTSSMSSTTTSPTTVKTTSTESAEPVEPVTRVCRTPTSLPTTRSRLESWLVSFENPRPKCKCPNYFVSRAESNSLDLVVPPSLSRWPCTAAEGAVEAVEVVSNPIGMMTGDLLLASCLAVLCGIMLMFSSSLRWSRQRRRIRRGSKWGRRWIRRRRWIWRGLRRGLRRRRKPLVDTFRPHSA